MEKFDILKVLDRYQPDVNELSKILFPDAKYPKQAFARVIKGEASLDTSQLVALAEYLGVVIQDLFAGSAWSSCIEDNYMCFIKGCYKAKLNYAGAYLTLYKNSEVIEQYIGNIGNMKVTEFFEYLDNNIAEYEAKVNN